jgi:hypothetical protein
VNAHFALGTHRLLEPVSNTTWNDCGGVPSSMAPKYCASMKLVMGTDARDPDESGESASDREFRNQGRQTELILPGARARRADGHQGGREPAFRDAHARERGGLEFGRGLRAIEEGVSDRAFEIWCSA